MRDRAESPDAEKPRAEPGVEAEAEAWPIAAISPPNLRV